jgi:hypothetical protein
MRIDGIGQGYFNLLLTSREILSVGDSVILFVPQGSDGTHEVRFGGAGGD